MSNLTTTPILSSGVDGNPPVTMLRWIFRRGIKALTCEVASTAGRFEVSLVPHWNVAASLIESFDAPIPALSQHARIARRLQEAGWVVDHVPVMDAGPDPVRAAA